MNDSFAKLLILVALCTAMAVAPIGHCAGNQMGVCDEWCRTRGWDDGEGGFGTSCWCVRDGEKRSQKQIESNAKESER